MPFQNWTGSFNELINSATIQLTLTRQCLKTLSKPSVIRASHTLKQNTNDKRKRGEAPRSARIPISNQSIDV